MINTLFSEEPKDKISVLNKQKQMTADAKTLSYDEWNKKWGGMDEEDTKAFMPGRVYEGKTTYNMFRGFDTSVYDQRIATETKRIEGQKKADELLSKEADQKAGFIKTYIQNKSTAENLYKEIPTKFGFDPNENLDPVEYFKSGMIKEAEDRIKNKKGVGLTGDPKNEMVCIKGVCTLVANQGVDFRGAFGGYKEGVDTDELGRLIPQYNKYFSESYAKAGFQKLPKGERPKPGDLVQYYNLGQGVARHMEMVLADKGNAFETFNNYDLYNEYLNDPNKPAGLGRSTRRIEGGVNRLMNTSWGQEGDDAEFYRITPEAAAAALSKNAEYTKRVQGKKTYETSEEKKAFDAAEKFLAANKDINVLGDDQGLMQDLIKGVQSGKPKEDILKSLIPKSKNPKLLERVITNLY